MHGSYLVVERWLRDRWGERAIWRRRGVRLGLALATYALVCLTWVFFRAHDFAQAFRICAAMFGGGGAPSHPDWCYVLLPVGGLVACHWVLRRTTLEAAVERVPWPVLATVLAVMVVSLIMFPGVDRAFIYFQF